MYQLRTTKWLLSPIDVGVGNYAKLLNFISK